MRALSVEKHRNTKWSFYLGITHNKILVAVRFGKNSSDSFDVVIPSLPGFGFNIS